jgi:hypothetical protein
LPSHRWLKEVARRDGTRRTDAQKSAARKQIGEGRDEPQSSTRAKIPKIE